MIEGLLALGGFFLIISLVIYFESEARGRCEHLRTRCIHADEITHRTKVYSIRWWKEPVVRRQACLDCGAALDRVAICTATGEDRHEWTGPWPQQYVVEHGEPHL